MPAPRKLNYARPKAQAVARAEDNPATETAVPLVLLIVGLLMLVVAGFVHVGARSLAVYMIAIAIALVIVTVIRVIAAFVAATVLNTSFGAVPSALLKFAGIFTFTGGIEELFPFTGVSLLTGVVALGLLVWLFQIELYEALIFSVVAWLIGFVVRMFLYASLVSGS